MERLELRITGRVQGVAFRHHTVQRARGLGLVGWVRNESDGSVRLVAEGERGALETLRAWAAEGPPHARVDDQQAEWSDATGDFGDFDVKG